MVILFCLTWFFSFCSLMVLLRFSLLLVLLNIECADSGWFELMLLRLGVKDGVLLLI